MGPKRELFAWSFSHTTKILQDVLHCPLLSMALRKPPMTEFLFHVILISSGNCTVNRCLGKRNDLTKYPSCHARKTGPHLQLSCCQPCLSNETLQLSRLAHAQGASLSCSPFFFFFCKLCKEVYFHNRNISLCSDTFFTSLKGPR